jgi:LPPG:FO 2-phospho-L-lactate transferase
LDATAAPVVAISPIVGGAAIKGPAAPLMQALGYEVSARGVAACYAGLADVLVIDNIDAALADDIRATGMKVVITDTIMRGADAKRALAQTALDAARKLKMEH